MTTPLNYVLRAALLLALIYVLPTAASAQTYTTYQWNIVGSGNWNSATNWDTSSVPASAVGTQLIFDGTVANQATSTQVVATNDIGSLTLSNLTAQNLANGSGYTVTGGTLNFVPTTDSFNPSIVYNGGTNTRALIINSAVNVGSNTLEINVNTASSATNTYEIIINGNVSGTGAITRTDGASGGEVVFGGANGSFSGIYNSGTSTSTILAAANIFSRTATLNFSNTGNGLATTVQVGANFTNQGVTLGSANQQIGTLSGGGTAGNAAQGTLQYGSGTQASIVAVGFNNSNSVYSGSLSTSNDSAQFVKIGTGTLTITGATGGPTNPATSSFRGGFTVQDGVVLVGGAGNSVGTLGTTSSTVSTALSVAATSGGELRLVTGTSTNGRLQNNASVLLAGGLLRFDASSLATSGTGLSEVTGALTIGAGQSTIRIDTPSGRGARLNFTTFTQGAATGTVLFQSNNTGTGSFNTANTGNFAFTTTPTLVGGAGNSTSTNQSILPSALGTTSNTGSPTTLVTYDTTNSSIRGVADSNYAIDFSGAASNNVSVSSSQTVGAGSNNVANALRLGGITAFTQTLSGNTLTLTAGALLNANTDTTTGVNATSVSNGTLAFGAAGALTAYITTTNDLNITANISALNLSKSGAGNLTFSGPITLGSGGVVAVNAGTLTLNNGSTAVTNATTYQVSRGAKLDVTANGLALGTGTTLTGGAATISTGAVTGNVTVNTGSTIRPNSLGGTSALSPGTLVINGTLTLNSGSTYDWVVSSALTNGDNSVIPTTATIASGNYLSPYTASLISKGAGSLTIDLSGASSSNKITIKVTPLTLANGSATPGSSAIYDFDPTKDTRYWYLADATSITGFNSGKFQVDARLFDTNGSGLGTLSNNFSVIQVDNSLFLQYTPTPVPEPASLLAIAGLAFGAARYARRRFRKS